MFSLFTVLIILAVTYAFWREGLLTCCTMLINVVLAGLITYGFFEPVAEQMESLVGESVMAGWVDFVAQILLFSMSLGILRAATNGLATTELEENPLALRVGGVLCGVVTGYLVAGFLICACLTIPLPKGATFMGFDSSVDTQKSNQGTRAWLPPDRVWLALMHRAGAKTFSWGDGPTFDPHGNYLLRQTRYRRYDESGKFVRKEKFLKVK